MSHHQLRRDNKKGLSGLPDWMKKALEPITGPIQAYSPPKEGPLSEIDVWGENIGRTFVESIGLGISSSSLSSALSGVSLSHFALPTTSTSALQSGSGGIINATINLTLPAMSNREEAVEYGTAAGQAAGQSLAEVLRGQATNAGVSTINMMR